MNPSDLTDAFRKSVTLEWAVFEAQFRQGVADSNVDAVLDAAAGVEQLFADMTRQRDEVALRHPWKFGLSLCWMTEMLDIETRQQLYDHTLFTEAMRWDKAQADYVPDENIAVTRWDVFKSLGFAPDQDFNAWAEEWTGVRYKTFMGWMHACRTYFFSPEGQDVLEKAQLEPEDFAQRVSMDKALRAVSAVGKGQLEDFQLDDLVDQNVTSAALTDTLKMTASEHAARKGEEEKQEREWVDKGNTVVVCNVQFDVSRRQLTVAGYLPGGQPFSRVIASFPFQDTAFGDWLVGQIIAFVEGTVKDLRPTTVQADDMDVLFNQLYQAAVQRQGVQV